MASELEKIISNNIPVKITATRNIPALETIGINLTEKEEGASFDLPFWIARILVTSGLARYVDQGISQEEWMQIHFKEKFNPLGPLSSLPENFYKRAYLSLFLSKQGSQTDHNRREVFNRHWARFRDILEARIGKISRLSSIETIANQQRMEQMEIILYEALKKNITHWRNTMRLIGDE
jgi:hypothetical protein